VRFVEYPVPVRIEAVTELFAAWTALEFNFNQFVGARFDAEFFFGNNDRQPAGGVNQRDLPGIKQVFHYSRFFAGQVAGVDGAGVERFPVN
jgi:hypothetical protein